MAGGGEGPAAGTTLKPTWAGTKMRARDLRKHGQHLSHPPTTGHVCIWGNARSRNHSSLSFQRQQQQLTRNCITRCQVGRCRRECCLIGGIGEDAIPPSANMCTTKSGNTQEPTHGNEHHNSNMCYTEKSACADAGHRRGRQRHKNACVTICTPWTRDAPTT